MSYALVKNEAETSASEDGSSTHVPGGWGHLRLDELYQISMGTTLLASSTQEKPKQGYIPVYSATEKDHYFGYVLATTVKNVLREGDIVVPARGTIGSPKYVSLMAASTQTTIQMRPRGEINKYNFYYIKHHRDSLFPVLPGTIPQLTVANVSRCFILVPPLAEQTAIANILSDQEALVAHYNDLIALHEKRFAYLSDELLSGRVRLVQKEAGEVELVKNNDWRKSVVNAVVMDIPLEWKTLKLKELCTDPVTKGTTPSSIGHHFLDSGTVNFYKVENLKHNQLLRSNVYISPECHASLKRSQLQAYDLLFSIAGTIGNVGLVTEHHLPGNVNQAIAIIRPTQKGQSLYLLYLMRNFIESMTAKKLGNVIPNFNLEMLKTVEILLPPIEEQTLIAQVLSDQEALIAQYKKLRDAEKKRFDWLSDALLSGTYRVKVEA